MRIDIVSAVPQVLKSPLEQSIIKNALDQGFVEIHYHDLHDFTTNKHNKIDDYVYGGSAGMVLSAQPIFDCIEGLKAERDYDEVIFMAPDGECLHQQMANRMSLYENIIILCGHYKGVDQRVRDHLITKEISIGDFVLTGGELPALVLIDSVVRLIPGVLGDAESALSDSFQDLLLEGPVYTRPADFRGMRVPEVLTSGDHKKVEVWMRDQAIAKTKERRPDLYQRFLNEQ